MIIKQPYLPLAFSALCILTACDHQGAQSDAPSEAESHEIASIRRENAELQRQLRTLQEQMRMVNAADVDSWDGEEVDPGPERVPELPVVRLEPTGEAPSSGFGGDPDLEYEAQGPSPAPMASADGPAERYRLVGSHLVQETKRKRAPRRAPKKRGKARSAKQRDAVVREYEEAMEVYRAGRFGDAELAFDRIVSTNPNHDYADNALYWKGESAYDQDHYSDALAAFTEVVERYGGGNKAPDALLKIGLCYGRLGDVANAKDVLEQLIAAYPSARASGIAQNKLNEL